MLRVARNAWVGKTGRAGLADRDLDCVAEPPKSGCAQTALDRLEQLGDPRLRRVRPLGLRDQVDLSPVEPLRDDLRRDTAARKLGDGRGRRGVECNVLLRCRLASQDEPEAVLVCLE